MFRTTFKLANHVNHEEAETFVVTCEVLLPLDYIDQKNFEIINGGSLLGAERKRYLCLLNEGVKRVYSGTFFILPRCVPAKVILQQKCLWSSFDL